MRHAAVQRFANLALSLLLVGQVACSTELASTAAPNEQAQTAALRILALGDSYTIGTSVSVDDRWPNLLQQQLIANGIHTKKPEIIARNGWTTANLLAGLSAVADHNSYDWVTLMIGVNNQFQGRSLGVFQQQLSELIMRSVALAGNKPSRVIVLSIPDWGVSDFGQAAGAAKIAEDIARFNAVVRQEAELADAVFIDVALLVELARQDSSYLASDRLHFSGKMHALWAERVAAVIN